MKAHSGLSVIIGILLITITSCVKVPSNRLGFSSRFDHQSEGARDLYIMKDAGKIWLSGKVILSEGGVEINFTRPDGGPAYSTYISEPGEITFFREFDAISGYWELSYSSRNGRGTIDLHIIYY